MKQEQNILPQFTRNEKIMSLVVFTLVLIIAYFTMPENYILLPNQIISQVESVSGTIVDKKADVTAIGRGGMSASPILLCDIDGEIKEVSVEWSYRNKGGENRLSERIRWYNTVKVGDIIENISKIPDIQNKYHGDYIYCYFVNGIDGSWL